MTNISNTGILTRRQVLKIFGIGVASTFFPVCTESKKTHIITLSFDDGFLKSSLKTVEIYEKYGLSACINVIATAHLKTFKLPNEYHKWAVGDFGIWNELQERGHEIMPHGYMHQNLSQISFEKAKDLIMRCLDFFSKELKGFEPANSVFNFPYNASTPELEDWLPTQVKGFRTGGEAINALPHKDQVKLTCTSFGPENIDKDLKQKIDELFSRPSGWLIYNAHGLDDEGWGPMSSIFLDDLLKQLTSIDSVSVLPSGRALLNSVST
jgi:peptidoglycan/xylan/chitin deacetylase (PgdA/CDA1 family)